MFFLTFLVFINIISSVFPFCIFHQNSFASCERGVGIPKNLPSNTTTLKITRNYFANNLQKQQINKLSALKNLQQLFIVDCNINSIEPGSFEDLKKLSSLELSYNHISGTECFQNVSL